MCACTLDADARCPRTRSPGLGRRHSAAAVRDRAGRQSTPPHNPGQSPRSLDQSTARTAARNPASRAPGAHRAHPSAEPPPSPQPGESRASASRAHHAHPPLTIAPISDPLPRSARAASTAPYRATTSPPRASLPRPLGRSCAAAAWAHPSAFPRVVPRLLGTSRPITPPVAARHACAPEPDCRARTTGPPPRSASRSIRCPKNLASTVSRRFTVRGWRRGIALATPPSRAIRSPRAASHCRAAREAKLGDIAADHRARSPRQAQPIRAPIHVKQCATPNA